MTTYNKVTLDGTTLMDISDTTAVASDVASGKYFYNASGTKTTGTSTAIVPTGTKSITENGTGIDVMAYASVDVDVPTGSSKNIQVYSGYDEVASDSYTATDVSLTVAKTGTYKVSWTGWRSSSAGTSGSRLYIGGTTYGSVKTAFTRTYGQSITLTGVSLTQGQTITVYARSRGSSYYMCVGNLIIEEQ